MSVLFLIFLKPVDKAVNVCRTNISADDFISIDNNICIYPARFTGVIRYLISITFYVLVLITRKVEALTLLYFVISRKDFIKFFRNGYLFALNGLALNLPAKLGKEVYPVLIGFYLIISYLLLLTRSYVTKLSAVIFGNKSYHGNDRCNCNAYHGKKF